MKVLNNFCFTSIILLLLMQLSACGVKEQLDEMHDSTVAMRGNTEAMEDSTADMGVTTEELSEATQTMFTLLRSKDAEDTRRNALLQMREAKAIMHKFEMASVYWQSFEFQLWSMTNTDRNASREYFYRLAAEEFFASVTEYITDWSFDLKKINPATKKSDELNMFAFACMMHYVHENQLRTHQKYPAFKVVSFYDLLTNALKKQAAYENGDLAEDDLKMYEKLILRNADISIYLLQLRYNMFTTAALSKLSGIDQASLYANLKKFLIPWKLDLSKVSRAKQIESLEYLTFAADTKKFLKSIGYKTRLNSKINRMVKNMHLFHSSNRVFEEDQFQRIKHKFAQVKN